MMPLSPVFAGSSMVITSPDGGEVWSLGTEYTITWTYGSVIPTGPCVVSVSYNDGTSWQEIATVPQNQTFVKWTIPEDYYITNSARIKIRVPVSSQGSTSEFDISDSFSIKSPNAPNPPGSTLVVYSGASGIKIAWEDSSSNETGFYVYRKKGNDGDYLSIKTLGSNITSFTDYSLNEGYEYFYKVCAYNTYGASAYSPEVGISFPFMEAPKEPNANATRTGTGILLTWMDNSNNEDGFKIWRKKSGDSSFRSIAETAENVTQYTDSGLDTGTNYIYQISSFKGSSFSSYAITSATTLAGSSEDSLSSLTQLSSLQAPSELKAVLNADGTVQLSWIDNATGEKGFKIERNANGSDVFTQIASVGENVTTYSDSGDFTGTVNYRVRAYTTLSSSSYSNTASIVPSESELSDETVDSTEIPVVTDDECILCFYIDNVGYKVNGQTLIADVSPTIKNSRTLMPVRYIATPLGAEVGWDPDEQKVTVTLDDTKLEMWIGRNTALVNGVSEMIDPDNPEVMPEILPPGRTMLPLRFIAEKLGCEVDWEPSIKEVMLTYEKP
jgi:titin